MSRECTSFSLRYVSATVQRVYILLITVCFNDGPGTLDATCCEYVSAQVSDTFLPCVVCSNVQKDEQMDDARFQQTIAFQQLR